MLVLYLGLVESPQPFLLAGGPGNHPEVFDLVPRRDRDPFSSEPDELRPNEVLEFMDRSMKLERTIRGEPAEIREERVSGHVSTDLWTRVDNYVAVLRARSGDGGIPPGVVPGDGGGQPLAEAKAHLAPSSVPALDV